MGLYQSFRWLVKFREGLLTNIRFSKHSYRGLRSFWKGFYSMKRVCCFLLPGGFYVGFWVVAQRHDGCSYVSAIYA